MALYSDMAAFYEEAFPPREEVLRFLQGMFGPGGGPLLDVGCGPGGLARALRERGLDVTGIDADPAMIARARERDRGGRFLHLDMRRVEEAGAGFRGGFCLGNVLSHVARGEVEGFLASLGKVLDAGSPWIVQTVNWDGLEGRKGFRFPEKTLPGGGILLREYIRLPGGAFLFSLQVRRGGETLLSGEEVLHPLPAAEMDRLHAAAGFEREGRWGDFRLGDFDPEALPGGNVTAYRFTGS